jgi:hypothetical protein
MRKYLKAIVLLVGIALVLSLSAGVVYAGPKGVGPVKSCYKLAENLDRSFDTATAGNWEVLSSPCCVRNPCTGKHAPAVKVLVMKPTGAQVRYTFENGDIYGERVHMLHRYVLCRDGRSRVTTLIDSQDKCNTL